MSSKESKKKTPVQLSPDETKGLIERLQASNLTDADKEILVGIVGLVITLGGMVQRRKIALMSYLRRVFGHKTEKHTSGKDKRDNGDDQPPDEPPKSGKGDEGGPRKKRPNHHGRNGRDKYPGAKRVSVKNEDLAVGDPCPSCHGGPLGLAEPGVAYRWSGQTPLDLTIFELERLTCKICKASFVASVPGETPTASTVDLPGSVVRGGAAERSCDATAAAMLACLRFEMGVPHFRLSEIQAGRGLPLAPGTQYKMMDGLREPATSVFAALERYAGTCGELFLNDDTGQRILDVERGKVPVPPPPDNQSPPKLLRPRRSKDEKPKTRTQTSGIVAHSGEHTVCLYYTGLAQAGENLAKVLRHRAKDKPTPTQMCDGLAANVAEGFETTLCNCLDHARRGYYDLEPYYPEEIGFVLTTLGHVYKNDADTKRLNMDAAARLAFHQEHSAPHMEKLEQWATALRASKKATPKDPINKPLKYMLKRWDRLTQFLRVPGAPLSSTEVERLIKRCIRHRKNSLQYKTERGALLGDMLMSLIQTCRYAKESAFDYLAALKHHEAAVIANPESWLPWNWRVTLAAMTV